MYEDLKIIPDVAGIGPRYAMSRATPKLLAWSATALIAGALIASLLYHWSVAVSAGIVLLLAFTLWKVSRMREIPPPFCPQCGTETFLIRKKRSGSEERLLLFARTKCRIAVDSGIVEDGVLDE